MYLLLCADWAGASDDRKSTYGYIILFQISGGAVTWSGKNNHESLY